MSYLGLNSIAKGDNKAKIELSPLYPYCASEAHGLAPTEILL